jgi:hypothetical protein
MADQFDPNIPRYTWENDEGNRWGVFDNENHRWVNFHTLSDEVKDEIGLPPIADPILLPGGEFWVPRGEQGDGDGGDGDIFLIDNDGDGIDDREQEDTLTPSSNWNLGQAGPGPFAMMAPWAAWNALPNMIAELNRTMDYWLTQNQRQALERSKLWAMLKAMGMITGNQIDNDGNVTPIEDGGGYAGDGGGSGDGGRRGGYGPGPSSIVNLSSSQTSPTSASYGDRIGVTTAPRSQMPLLSGRALTNLTSGAGATDPLSDITSQGLGSAGLGAVSGVVEPSVSQAGAQQQFAQSKQLADQTVAAGQFAAGLGQQAGDLGKEAFETEMRKRLRLVGPFMQSFGQYVS